MLAMVGNARESLVFRCEKCKHSRPREQFPSANRSNNLRHEKLFKLISDIYSAMLAQMGKEFLRRALPLSSDSKELAQEHRRRR